MKTEGDNITLTQLAEILERLEDKINDLEIATQELAAQDTIRKKLSDAGRRSAEARKAKFGSANPLVFSGPRNIDTATPKGTKAAAQRALRLAVKSGQVIKPMYCSHCLRDGDVQGHHHDYTKALEVSWLCITCHRQLHNAPLPISGFSPEMRPAVEIETVWASYERSYVHRYGVKPIRNAKVNGQCKQLEKQLGARDAMHLVAYYLDRNDAYYVAKSHPIGLCLLDAQKLCTEQANGRVITMIDARRIEAGSATDRALKQYAASQQLQAEQVNEGVQPAEVLQ